MNPVRSELDVDTADGLDGNGSDGESGKGLHGIKRELHQQVIAALDLASMGTLRETDLRLEVRKVTEELCARRSDLLSLNEREGLVNEVPG